MPHLTDAAIAQAFRDYQTNWPGDADTGMAGWIEAALAGSQGEGVDQLKAAGFNGIVTIPRQDKEDN